MKKINYNRAYKKDKIEFILVLIVLMNNRKKLKILRMMFNIAITH